MARTQDEIRRTMHVALEEPLPGLVANWRFSEGYEDNIGGFDSTPTGVLLIFSTTPAQPAYADVIDVNFNTLPQARFGAATVYLPTRDKALLIGGQRTSTAVVADVHAVNGTTGARTTLGSLPAVRAYPAAAYVPTTDQVYVFGGSSTYQFNTTAQNTIYKVNPDSGATTTLPTVLPVTDAALAAVYHPAHDKVYLFGGINAGGVLTDVFVFDPATETILPAGFALPQGMMKTAAVLFRGRQTGSFCSVAMTAAASTTSTKCISMPMAFNGSITLLPAALPVTTHALGVFEDPHTQLDLPDGRLCPKLGVGLRSCDS